MGLSRLSHNINGHKSMLHAVVGAGVIGLSTALHLTERFSDALQVTILADRFTPDTVSDKSGAVKKPISTKAI